MSINQRDFLSLSYSCAAAFSVWIPKPFQTQHTVGKLSLEELGQKHLTKGYRSSDSLFYKQIGTSKTNQL